jgi:hypothetical protein
MDKELRESFTLILKQIMGKHEFIGATKDQITDAGIAMMNLKMIAEHYCGAEAYEMLSLVINAERETNKIDVDEHIQYCKLLDIWQRSGLDISLLDKK